MNKEYLLQEFERALKDNNQELIAKISTLLEREQKPKFGMIDILSCEHRTAIIGNQEWMAENLFCPELGCHYNNNPENSKGGYGTLHTHYAIPSINEILPEDWRVPFDEDWSKLFGFVGDNPGTKLKSKTGWKEDGNGTDDFGFNVLPSGLREYNGSYFGNRGYNAFFWSSSARSDTYAWGRYFSYNEARVYRNSSYRSSGFSVRCVRDLK
jgi:uncharacterized protein (TIGR02145 family)